MAEYADEADDQSQAVEDDDQESALLPKSMFPEDVDVGYECKIKVVGMYESEVEIVKVKESESKDEPEEPSLEEGLDQLAESMP